MTKSYDIIVVGAGHNGLTTAAYLARAGLHVLVLEQRHMVGGACSSEEAIPGYRIDTCAHRIAGLRSQVFKDLELREHGVDIVVANPSVFAPVLNGQSLTIRADLAQTVHGLRAHSQRDAERYPNFLKLVERATHVVRTLHNHPVLRVPRPGLGDATVLLGLMRQFRSFDKRTRSNIARLLSMSVADLMEEWFETDVLQGTIGAAGVTGIFQGPMAAGTAYVLLHAHANAEAGSIRPTYFIRGGVGRLTQGLAAAAQRAGATIKMEARVQSILIKNGSAFGVALADGTEYHSRCVVSNADPRRTALTLINAVNLPPDIVRDAQNIKFRGVNAKIHLIVDQLPTFTDQPDEQTQLNGVISISPSVDYLERAYDSAKYGEISERPYLEITIPTLTDPSAAPERHHVISILAQYAPYRLARGPWDKTMTDLLGERVIATLKQYARNIEGTIVHRHVITPKALEHEYSLTEGNINHGDLTLDQVQFMRPFPDWSDYRTSIGNVYLCGAGTHAGGGVNCGPGYNAARIVLRDYKQRARR